MWLHWSNEKRDWQWTPSHAVLGNTIKAFGQGSLTSSQYCFPSGCVCSYASTEDTHAYDVCVVFTTVCCSHFLFLSSSAGFPPYLSTLICSHSCAGALMCNAVMNSSKRKHPKAPQGLSEETLTPLSLCSQCSICVKRQYSAQQNTWAVKPLYLDCTRWVISWPEKGRVWNLQDHQNNNALFPSCISLSPRAYCKWLQYQSHLEGHQ